MLRRRKTSSWRARLLGEKPSRWRLGGYKAKNENIKRKRKIRKLKRKVKETATLTNQEEFFYIYFL